MSDDFAVGRRMKDIAFTGKPFFDLLIVFNHPVMDNGQHVRATDVGVGIFIARLSVGGPAGVSHTDLAANRFLDQPRHQIVDASAGFGDCQLAAAIDGRHAATIVAPVFESPQSFDQKLRCFAMSDVSYNPTHSACLWLSACAVLFAVSFPLLPPASDAALEGKTSEPTLFLTTLTGRAKVSRSRFDLSGPQRIDYIIILLPVILCDEMVVFSSSRPARTQPITPNKRKRSPASCRHRSLERCRVRS